MHTLVCCLISYLFYHYYFFLPSYRYCYYYSKVFLVLGNFILLTSTFIQIDSFILGIIICFNVWGFVDKVILS